MELISKDTPQVKEFISSLDSILNGIESSEALQAPPERRAFSLQS